MKSLMRQDPFRIMRKWDPFQELFGMQHEMDRLFNRFLGRDISTTGTSYGEWMPLVESYIKDNDLIFRCELPGVDSKDVEVNLDEASRQLIIKGERKEEKNVKNEDYIYNELAYGAFERRFSLPEGVKSDRMKAKFSNGVLEVTVPVPAISRPKKIEIETPKQIEQQASVKKAA